MIDIIPDDLMELTIDEVEFLTLRYLYKQMLEGRDLIPESEVMEYLGMGNEPLDDERILRINADGIKQLKSLEIHYMN
jgi:hypothetical protein